ncbi:RpnC/YadD family protein [Thiomicrospira microaerophila]|uniref:hypothetical protein n=1 Tax=Thiomicrospira microaerophila TaxID=406020 RepID=UPI0005C958B6|nr:hypothetical protein [Thiomicrospira microaerophila]
MTTATGESIANPSNQDHDNPWKEALEYYFKDAMALLFSMVHQAIDWNQPPEFLDKELQKILAKAERGKTYADKLVKVKLISGEETWLLIHIEVQGEPEHDFAQRMFNYNSRIRQRYKKDVISLAILSDTSPTFKPQTYHYNALGFNLRMDYPVVKLLDFLPQRQSLLTGENVFGLLVLAQLDAKLLKTPQERLSAKVALIRQLYERGYSKEQIITLFNLIDWMITLPKELVIEFDHQIDAIEQEKNMQYINSLEDLYLERGKLEGRLEQAIEMIREFNLSVEIVAERCHLSIKELKERLSQIEK